MRNDKKSLVTLSIETPDGERIGILRYNPTALAAYRRSGAERRFLACIRALKDANITREGEPADASSEALVNDAEKACIAYLNKVTGTSAASEAFAKYRPFAAMSDGTFWADKIMSALGEIKEDLRRGR